MTGDDCDVDGMRDRLVLVVWLFGRARVLLMEGACGFVKSYGSGFAELRC